MGSRVRRKATDGAMTVGDLITCDAGELWRVVSVDPLVLRRCRDGRIGIEINRRSNGEG